MSKLAEKARAVAGSVLVTTGWKVLPESTRINIVKMVADGLVFPAQEDSAPAVRENGTGLEAEDARQEAENARPEAEDNLREAEARAEEAQRQAVAERPLGPTPDEDEPSYRLERGRAVRDRFKHMND